MRTISSYPLDDTPNAATSPQSWCVTGLSGQVEESSVICDMGLINVEVTGVDNVGGSVGVNKGRISASYATGSVAGNRNVGGLARTVVFPGSTQRTLFPTTE